VAVAVAVANVSLIERPHVHRGLLNRIRPWKIFAEKIVGHAADLSAKGFPAQVFRSLSCRAGVT